MNQPLVSIILPVYNAQNHLARCIGSILNQTYKNIELIILNDGSKDHSLPVCEEFRARDSRIVLVDKGCIPLPQNEVQRLALGGHVVEAQALPPALDAEAAPGDAAADRNGTAGHDDDVTDAEIISPDTANLSENEADATPAGSAASPADASKPVDASADASAADEAEKPRKQG